MLLKKARVQKYRSIRDSGYFDVENAKTILVGPNEAGKTALLEALQKINPPGVLKNFDALRDYPRSEFNDIITGKARLEDTTLVEGHFALSPADNEAIPEEFRDCTYVYGRRPDNSAWHALNGGPTPIKYGELKKDLARLSAHIDTRAPSVSNRIAGEPAPIAQLGALAKDWADTDEVTGVRAMQLRGWLEKVFPQIEEGNETEEKRYDQIMAAVDMDDRRNLALRTLHQRRPVFVRFRDYFRVRPLIHLQHLAQRLEENLVDDDYYDYGNQCLLRLLGFTARELSDLGKTDEPAMGDVLRLRARRSRVRSGRQSAQALGRISRRSWL